MDNKICKNFFLTKNGNFNRIIKKKFELLKNSEIYCLFNGQYKFIETFFPKFIGDSIEEIIKKICLFIKESDNFYYIFNPLDINVINEINLKKVKKNEYGYIINKNNLFDFFFYNGTCDLYKKNKEINSKNTLNNTLNNKNFFKQFDKKTISDVIIDFIKNININKIKNSLIFMYIRIKQYENPKKYKNIKNFKELYKLFDIEVISKDILKMLKKIKINMNEDKKIFKKEIKELGFNDNESINKFIIKKMVLKKLPNSINYYLKFVDDFYNKKYIKQEVKKILDKQKIKYKI